MRVYSDDIIDDCRSINLEPFFFDKPIYHYTSVDSALAILQGNTLKFSSVTDCNDPFDLYTDLIEINLLDRDIRKNYRATVPAKEQTKINELRYVAHYNEATKRFIEMQRRDSGIFCASTEPSNQLMWSHYTNKHTGVVLKLNLDIKNYANDYLSCHIKYANKVDPIKFSPDDNQLCIMNYFFTKSDVWSYEKEVRIVNVFKNGLMPFDKNDLIGIYFGLRTNIADVRKIQASIIENNYNFVTEQYMMAINNSTFDLIARKLQNCNS